MDISKKKFDEFIQFMEGKRFICPSCEEKVSVDYDTLMKMTNNTGESYKLLQDKILDFPCPDCGTVRIQIASHRIIDSWLSDKK